VASRDRGSDLQLATLVRAPPTGEGWLFEIKYDGYRALARKRGETVELVSRRGLRYGGLGAIRARIASLRCSEATLDGELCALDDAGRPSFEALQSALSDDDAKLVYFVFDLLSVDDVDLRALPLVERKRRLGTLVRKTDAGPVRRVVASAGDGAAFLEAVRALGLEGLIAKRANAPYRPGRGLDWQKVKTEARQELVVVGFTPPAGTRTGFGALLLGVHDERGLRYAGKVGTGFDETTLRTLLTRLRTSVVARPPIVDPPRMRGVTWVRPELVAEVRFSEWTRDGRLRHPVFLGLRPDKRAADVVREVARSPRARG
jgi:bifunctional non-homologous end joining protein LigD